MSKGEMYRHLADNLAESIGVREPVAEQEAATVSPAGAQAPAPDPYVDLRRLKGAGTLPVDAIVLVEDDPDQPRQQVDAEADAELFASVKARGLIQPIKVFKDSGTWKVGVGQRRYRAAVDAGMERVPVIYSDHAPTPAELLLERLIENLQRINLSPIDLSNAFRRYLELTGSTQASLAEELGVHPSKVSRALALTTLEPEAQEQVIAGKISPRAGVALAGLKDKEIQRAMATKAATEGLSTEEVGRAVRQRRGKPARTGSGRSGQRTFKAADGYTVTVSRKRGEMDPAGVNAALERALATSRAEAWSEAWAESTCG